MLVLHRCSAVALVVCCVGAVRAQSVYFDVGVERGILDYDMAHGMGGGVAAADYDDDGDIDLFVPTDANTPDQLYRNRGDGSFEEIAALVGLDSERRNRVALWFDYDGDSDLDLVVASDYWLGDRDGLSTLTLYQQQADGSFVDVTAGSGLDVDFVVLPDNHFGGMSAGDVNNDGYLDLCAGVWGRGLHLFINDTDGTFTDTSTSNGIWARRSHWQSVMHDFNHDGWLDIYSAIDFAPNVLFINNHDGTFDEIATAAGADNAWNDMGVALGDYDNDGDFDMYVTNIDGWGGPDRHSILYRNDWDGENVGFTEVSQSANCAFAHWGWGVTFTDCEADGLLDIAVTNGFNDIPWSFDPAKLFHNTGATPTVFQDASNVFGFNNLWIGSGLVTIDFDRDGDQDLFQTSQDRAFLPAPLLLLENRGAQRGNYLVVQPRMDGPNARAIGAVVRARVGEVRYSRLITAGISFESQEPAESFFGLGAATIVDQLVVEWPDGRTTTRVAVPANQQLVVRPTVGDMNCDGRTSVADINPFVLALNDPAGYAAAHPLCDRNHADTDRDGQIAANDITGFVAAVLGD